MKKRFHIPSNITWHAPSSGEEKARLQSALTRAIRRAVESSSEGTPEIIADDSERQGQNIIGEGSSQDSTYENRNDSAGRETELDN